MVDDLHVLTFAFLPAVKHMASSLAVEWAKKGVRVNVLRYDYVTSQMTVD